jgi:hypothetical protein
MTLRVNIIHHLDKIANSILPTINTGRCEGFTIKLGVGNAPQKVKLGIQC